MNVEVHLANGLPGFTIVGLPEASVRESKDRVRAAIHNSGFSFPNKRITVNLAPADLPKEGARYDLAIAAGILVASGQLPESILSNAEFLGELALSGALRAIRGALPSALACVAADRTLFLAEDNQKEAGLIHDVKAYAVRHLGDLLAHTEGHLLDIVKPSYEDMMPSSYLDFSDVKGQVHAKRALLIAAAGGHNILMVGPPGTGKSMLAERLPSILPTMTEEEALASASIYSISNIGFKEAQWRVRPFRHPHHSASAAALAGGGSQPKPGEISLAHHGVLFLDELPEFSRSVLETLREPLESGEISISRAGRQMTFPANFQLIAAMNPCPCGYLGDTKKACKDSPLQVERYLSRLSGPFLDRIDATIHVNRIEHANLQSETPAEWQSTYMREQVMASRNRQQARQGTCNANLSGQTLLDVCALSEPLQTMLEQAAKTLDLSMRSYHRIQRMARTIADLDASAEIKSEHLAEAIQLRRNTLTS